MTPLAQKVAETLDEALTSQDGTSFFRGDLLGEEWKVSIEYFGSDKEHFSIRVARRERNPE